MIRHGEAPYLECSSRGEKRLSAFYAKVNGKTIEQQYQAAKIFVNADGTNITNLHWKKAKGKTPINHEECHRLYSYLWDQYMKANPNLVKVIRDATGLSDLFGKEGHCCQATELWRIRNDKENF